MEGYDGEKAISMRQDTNRDGRERPCTPAVFESGLATLAVDLISPDYCEEHVAAHRSRIAAMPIEANVFHYGRSAWLGSTWILRQVMTHISYSTSLGSERRRLLKLF